MKKKSLVKNTILAATCLLLVIPVIIYGFPFLVGADGSYTVMSGSMSPALKPGDLLIVSEVESTSIDIGCIVTVESEEFTFTHRVVEKLEGDLFRLKGDANEEPDINLVGASQIIGKVVLVFPFSHLYTQYGFAASLLIPAILIIGKQMYNVYQFMRKRNKRETMEWRKKSHSALDMNTLFLALILTVSATRIIAPHLIGGSSSYFSDTEWAIGFFRAGIWEVGATVDIDPDVLNLKSQGQWITVHIETEDDEKEIVLSSVTLDESIPVVTDPKYDFVTDPDEYLVDLDGDDNYDARMVKFDRASVIAHLEGCQDGEEVTLTISGEFRNGIKFTGKDTIKVIHEVKDDEDQ